MPGQASRRLSYLALSLLTACSGGGSSEASTPRNAPPANLVAVDAGALIQLNWASVLDATEYRVYASASPGVTATETGLVATTESNSATIDPGGAGLTRYFTVTAMVSGQESFPAFEATNSPGGVDPLLSDQWHLNNTGANSGTFGEDINVDSVWASGITGRGVRVSIVDEGLEIGHEDLAPNVAKQRSFNYVDGTTDPTDGTLEPRHGTACAGVLGASKDNGLGGSGAAPDVEIVGFNALQNLTLGNEQNAATRDAEEVWISSNSWGAPDTFGAPQPSSSSWQAGIDAGTRTGRNGLGTVYFWAAGNGGEGNLDNSNLDGRANYSNVMAIGAVNSRGVSSFYSEPGANVWVCAPSNDNFLAAITTVDRSGIDGYNTGFQGADYSDQNYTRTFGGTSSATPLAAGVGALVLQANPNLGWRDVRRILALSARQNDPGDSDWVRNRGGSGLGHWVNHKYGYGVVDAAAAVALAQSTTANLPDLVTTSSETREINAEIPDGSSIGVSDTLLLSGSGISSIEFVRVLFDSSDHTWSADLEVELISPTGTSSLLAITRTLPASAGTPSPFSNFQFGCARLLDEPADGTWTLVVRDQSAGDSGTFVRWGITVYGH